ncbi:MAG: hypothetical protein GC181_13840 [Bacteroidetes bacterium]|nr:hypothetical protein [Bacteroidota bacterium]
MFSKPFVSNSSNLRAQFKSMLTKRSLSVLLAGFAVLILSCNQNRTPPVNYFSDSSMQTIASLQDQRNAKDLIHYLKAKHAMHRIAAAKAMGNICDTASISFLNVAMLTDQEKDVRKMAAWALGQYRDSSMCGKLCHAATLELDEATLASILEAIGKCADEEGVQLLSDFRRVEGIMAEGHAAGMMNARRMGKSPTGFFAHCKRYLDDEKSTALTKMYSAYAINKLPSDGEDICSLSENWKAKNTDPDVLVALKRICPETQPATELKPFDASAIDTSLAPYPLSTLLRSFSYSEIPAREYLENLAQVHRYQIVRTTAAELYFDSYADADSIDGALRSFLKYCLISKDPALISLAANYVTKTAGRFNYNLKRNIPSMLSYVRSTLKSPSQWETILDVEQAIAAQKRKTFVPPVVPYNHPVDWEAVKKISKDQQVVLKTNKGEMVIQLHVEQAPGSVWNFINEVNAGHYNNRYFHRVVPDFVIQGGCPRGDGWGSPDWCQRSEFTPYLRYKRGSVGLASVGKDTEGVQFFITHNATPHLDGRYTIFGEVIEGLDVIDKIELGDQIISISLR